MMRNTVIIVLFLFVATTVLAQKGKVNLAISQKDAGNLEKAVMTINEAIDPNNEKAAKSLVWPGTWMARGEIYQAVYQSKDDKNRSLSDNPLFDAYQSYQKAMELDEKGRFSKQLIIRLQMLINEVSEQAAVSFNNQKYKKAFESFSLVLDIEDLPVYKQSTSLVDTATIANAGLSAYKAGVFDEAIRYYTKALEYNYEGEKTYEMLALSYLEKSDTIAALDMMMKGVKEYPGNSDFLLRITDIYSAMNKLPEAMKFIDLAINEKPADALLYSFRGTLAERMQDVDAAILSYQKAMELKPDYFDAVFNLGVVHFNQGVKQLDMAIALPASETEKYEEEKAKADVEFRKALPYLEKAHQLDGKQALCLESLKNLYYRFGMNEKYAEVLEQLKDIN